LYYKESLFNDFYALIKLKNTLDEEQLLDLIFELCELCEDIDLIFTPEKDIISLIDIISDELKI